MPELILFDLGGVLIEVSGIRELRTLAPEPIEEEEIPQQWLLSESVRDFECGRISPGEFATRFLSEWNIPLSPAAFLSAFSNWIGGFYPGVESLLQDLHSRHRLACLSNTNEIHWDVMSDLLSPYLDSTFLSFKLGMAKPDPAIFMTVLADLGLAPEDVLFFDDSPLNVESANDVGLQAELVRGPVELNERLVQRGILPA